MVGGERRIPAGDEFLESSRPRREPGSEPAGGWFTLRNGAQGGPRGFQRTQGPTNSVGPLENFEMKGRRSRPFRRPW